MSIASKVQKFKVFYREFVGSKAILKSQTIIAPTAMKAKDIFCQKNDRHYSVILKTVKL